MPFLLTDIQLNKLNVGGSDLMKDLIKKVKIYNQRKKTLNKSFITKYKLDVVESFRKLSPLEKNKIEEFEKNNRTQKLFS